jgi:hypothetical protein
MRFMMFMYPGIEEKDWEPSAEDVAAMSRYNEELRKAGMLLSLDGLRPPSDGGVVSFSDGEATVTDGPFAEAKEVVARRRRRWSGRAAARVRTAGSRFDRSSRWMTSPRTFRTPCRRTSAAER